MPRFFYFDLGNVVLWFDHRLAARQIAEVVDAPAERVWDVVFAGGLNAGLDAGTVTSEQFYERLCHEFGCRPERVALELAASKIFELNYSMSAVIGQLLAAGHRLGLLSNTCEVHWDHFADGRYWVVPAAFEQIVLSCRVKQMKPDAAIYRLAAEQAGVLPEEVLYVDDLPANVAGARAAGFDAVQYTTTPAYVAELRKRGVRFNY